VINDIYLSQIEKSLYGMNNGTTYNIGIPSLQVTESSIVLGFNIISTITTTTITL
jgi:hypothetical protein